MKLLPWKNDKWNSRNGCVLPFDKAEHFIRDFIVAFAFSVYAALLFNLVWEFVDGTRPWALGSDIEGFSLKDFICGGCGAGLAFLLKGSCHGWLS